MKFTVTKENLLNGLNVVSKAVNHRSPLPVLSNVLIKTEKGRVELIASDLQITISALVGAKIDEPGEITVPAKILIEFANQINDDKLEFVLAGATLGLHTDKIDAKLNGIPATEFPVIEKLKGGVEFNFKSDEFLKAVQRVQYVVALDEGRPILTGIYFKAADRQFVLAGTDGYRMAEYVMGLNDVETNLAKDKEISCVLPARPFSDILKSFAPNSDGIKFTINSERNVATLKADDMEAQFKMIDGEYPDYKAVLPSDFSTEIRISSGEFSNGIKLASIFAKDMGNMIKIIAGEDGIESLSQPSEVGSNSTKMRGKVEGENIAVAFNAKYLLDFINNSNVPSGEIIFKASEPLKPVLFSNVGDENYFAEKKPGKILSNYRRSFYLVMPMKANW